MSHRDPRAIVKGKERKEGVSTSTSAYISSWNASVGGEPPFSILISRCLESPGGLVKADCWTQAWSGCSQGRWWRIYI